MTVRSTSPINSAKTFLQKKESTPLPFLIQRFVHDNSKILKQTPELQKACVFFGISHIKDPSHEAQQTFVDTCSQVIEKLLQTIPQHQPFLRFTNLSPVDIFGDSELFHDFFLTLYHSIHTNTKLQEACKAFGLIPGTENFQTRALCTIKMLRNHFLPLHIVEFKSYTPQNIYNTPSIFHVFFTTLYKYYFSQTTFDIIRKNYTTQKMCMAFGIPFSSPKVFSQKSIEVVTSLIQDANAVAISPIIAELQPEEITTTPFFFIMLLTSLYQKSLQKIMQLTNDSSCANVICTSKKVFCLPVEVCTPNTKTLNFLDSSIKTLPQYMQKLTGLTKLHSNSNLPLPKDLSFLSSLIKNKEHAPSSHLSA